MEPDVELLKRTTLFRGLPLTLLDKALRWSRTLDLAAGQYVVREGDPGMELYVVVEGQVEVLGSAAPGQPGSVVARLGQGETFGEMAMITRHPRSASLCVPQRARLLEISEDFVKVLIQEPLFLRRLCQLLAFRLEVTNAKLARQAPQGGLEGDLRYFDLPTVFQTLISSALSGMLVLHDDEGVWAEAALLQGSVVGARVGRLGGEEAFLQIFLSEASGRFSLRDEPVSRGCLGTTIDKPAMSLLLEGCRMKDELPHLLQKVGGASRILRPTALQLRWPGEVVPPLAQLVWNQARSGKAVGAIVASLPCCTFNGLSLLDKFLELELLD